MSLITQRLRDENINLSGGRIESERAEYLVRTLNQFQNLDEIRNIYLTTRNNRPIFLKDVAIVENGYKERNAISRVRGMEAVEDSLYKEGDANTVEVRSEAHTAELQSRPPLVCRLLLEKKKKHTHKDEKCAAHT